MLNCLMFIPSGLHSEHISDAHFALMKTTVGGLGVFMTLPSCLLVLKFFVLVGLDLFI